MRLKWDFLTTCNNNNKNYYKTALHYMKTRRFFGPNEVVAIIILKYFNSCRNVNNAAKWIHTHISTWACCNAKWHMWFSNCSTRNYKLPSSWKLNETPHASSGGAEVPHCHTYNVWHEGCACATPKSELFPTLFIFLLFAATLNVLNSMCHLQQWLTARPCKAMPKKRNGSNSYWLNAAATFATVYNRATKQCSKLPFRQRKASSNIGSTTKTIAATTTTVLAAVNTIIARAVANYMQQATTRRP